MDTMIVMYNLAEHQDTTEFETWLQTVDMPGYAKLQSMQNPVYYRTSGLLGESGSAPFQYIVTIEMENAAAVETEMAAPEWEGFITDFEQRTQNHAFVVAERILPT